MSGVALTAVSDSEYQPPKKAEPKMRR